MIAALLTIASGAFGWFGAKLMFEPLREIWDLRTEVQECLFDYGNLPSDAPGSVRNDAGFAFRHVGVRLCARHLAAWWWVKGFYWYVLGTDIYSAGEACMGLGKAIREGGYSQPNLGFLAPVIRSRLRLPTPYPTQALTELHASMGWSPPEALPPGDGEKRGRWPRRQVGYWRRAGK